MSGELRGRFRPIVALDDKARALIGTEWIFLGEREATSTEGGNFVAVEDESSTNYDDASLSRTVSTSKKRSRSRDVSAGEISRSMGKHGSRCSLQC